MTAFTSDWQETVETIEDATYGHYDEAVERYSEKDGYYLVKDLVRVSGKVVVEQVHPVQPETDSEATRALRRLMEGQNRVTEQDVEDFNTVKDALVDGETRPWPEGGNAVDEQAPTCAHCGSCRTFWRSDGDVGCNDCVGITTTEDQGEVEA